MTSNERLNKMVEDILNAIENGEDEKPLIARLYKAQPFIIAQMGIEYTDEAINRTKEEDGKFTPDQETSS